MSIALEDVISRSGDRQVRDLLGPAASRLIGVLEPGLIGTGRLRQLVLEIQEPVLLLSNPDTWMILVDLLPYENAVELADLLTGSPPALAYQSLRQIRFTGEDRDRKALILRYFGILAEQRAGIDFEPTLKTVDPTYGLFPHQRRAAESVLTHLGAEGARRCILHLPTGAGKTRTTMHVICEWLKRNANTTVTWLAHSSELLDQAAVEFERAWAALGDREMHVYRFWGDRNPRLDDCPEGFIVGGLGKLWGMYCNDQSTLLALADRTSLVVFDEAHQAIARTYRRLTDLLSRKRANTAVLGLTATPGRTWDNPTADAELSEYFDRTKVSLEIPGYPDPVEFLVANGYLARTRFVALNLSTSVELTAADQMELAESFDIPPAVLTRLAEDEQRNLRIVHAVERLARHHNRIIVFTATVANAVLLAAILRARGIESDSVSGATETTQRERIIRKFRSNLDRPLVLCNFGVLTTGFDAPATSAAVIARPTRSLVLYSQMVGRAIRGPLAGGREEADILTVVDPGLRGFGSVTDAFNNWEDVW